jgi:hypothetical protein
MLKSWMRDITLAIQARSGVSLALLVSAAVIVVGSLTAFVFLCVAAYDWLAVQWGNIVAGLAMAGIFVLIAVIGAIVCAVAHRRAKQRAINELAARAQPPLSWLDPKILNIAMQAGRALGWERVVPIAVLGLMAAQWVHDYRERHPGGGDNSPG